MLFKFYELEYKENNIKNAEYYNSNNILDCNQNYIFEIDSIPVGIYISDFITDDIILDDNFFKFLKKQITISQNRGCIAGKLDIDKLQPCYKRYMEDVNEFNESGSRTKKNKDINFEFSNPIRSSIITKDKPLYIKNEKLYEKHLKKLIKNIHKQLKSSFQIPKQYDEGLYNGYYNQMIINHRLRSAVHKDVKNKFPYSSLICLSNNKDLKQHVISFVDYDIGIPMINNKSLLIFNSIDIRHSNNEMNEELLKDRYSIVFYKK
jgi:hypothetical protein